MSDVQRFMAAVKAGDDARVREMLDQNPGLLQARSETGESAILLAAYYRHGRVAQVLLSKGALLDIFEAAALGHIESVKKHLLANPDLVNVLSGDGFPPLGLAAYFGHEELAGLLLSLGAKVNQASSNAMRVTPLHGAVAGRHTTISRMLVAAGADVNAVQSGGWTPLQQAAQHGDVEVIELLLTHGARVNDSSDDGRTALALAVEKGHQQAADLLRSHGAV